MSDMGRSRKRRSGEPGERPVPTLPSRHNTMQAIHKHAIRSRTHATRATPQQTCHPCRIRAIRATYATSRLSGGIRSTRALVINEPDNGKLIPGCGEGVLISPHGCSAADGGGGGGGGKGVSIATASAETSMFHFCSD